MNPQARAERDGTDVPTAQQTVRLSKMLSKTLRHDPGRVGLTLDDGGWVGIDTLLAAFERHGTTITPAELEHVVEHNDKRRFIIDGGRIRANQGHSIDVDLGLEPQTPPPNLYHGTGAGSVESILATGIHSGNRQHVHLSADVDTARRVGSRHGKPVVLVVEAAAMAAAGTTFFRSANGVWLVDAVPPRHVRRQAP
ncbi:RNA 2'-phosphotransferase [Myceligenerans crystallogenes]|uniref:Probable RNA 2'-phosphotransferase n=1 Tax=Myceligenerans crystallogenes TaxID=316335 RepID=A0ABN2NKJ8_9MICO